MGAHRDGGHGTSYSEKYYDGDRPAAMHNKNVEWLRYAHFWWLYLGFVAFFVTLLRLTVLSKAEDLGMVLTVTHVVHNLVFFYLFHWIKGSPDNFSQGEFNGLTLWEQIDDGIPWTKTKKLFFLVHTALVFAVSYVTDYDFNYLAINAPVYVLLGIIPKIPEMHRVRVFGWNKTAGIDDVHEEMPTPSATAAGGAVTGGSRKKR